MTFLLEFRFKLLFSLCDDKESRKRTTRASILAANRAASSSSESEEVSQILMVPYGIVSNRHEITTSLKRVT